MATLFSLWDSVKLPNFPAGCGEIGVTTAGVVTTGEILKMIFFIFFYEILFFTNLSCFFSLKLGIQILTLHRGIRPKLKRILVPVAR